MNEGLTFRLNGIDVRIERGPLEIFDAIRQTRLFQREAGGQLFGRADVARWNVVHATRPGLRDRRCRFGFRPDRGREQRDINDFHARGFDYLGDWHTHPENAPTPSPRDLRSITDIVEKSTYDLPGLLLCIVGRLAFPTGLWLSLHLRN